MIIYKSIRELLLASEWEETPTQDHFEMLRFDGARTSLITKMPPHRRGFYTVIFLKDQKKGIIGSNQDQHRSLSNTLLFQGTEHIFSFTRDVAMSGTVILFEASFLLPFSSDPTIDFPFFSPMEKNTLQLDSTQQASFENLIGAISQERENGAVAKPLLFALLEKSRQQFLCSNEGGSFNTKKGVLVQRYKNLVANFFVTHREAGFYSEKLNVSPGYLNEVIKKETGTSVKRHLLERLLLEAMNLLRYSELDIAEISYALNFSEPTHFTKFFKKETGETPLGFRKRQP